MSKKVLMLISMVLVIGILLAGCASKGESSSSSTSTEEKEKEIVIGMVANNIGIDTYQTTHDATFRSYAKELGVEAVVLDAGGDVNKQINQVMDLMTKQVDVIVLWPVNGEALAPAVKQAKEAGFKIVIANTPIAESVMEYVDAYAGPDNFKQGVYAGEMLVEGLKAAGKDLSNVKVVELMGQAGYLTAHERSNGIQSALKDAGVECLEIQPADWSREKAQKVMENLITKYGTLDAVACANDNEALGAIAALEEAGKLEGTVITSCNQMGEGYEAIEDGELYGSEDQSPVVDAKLTLETAIKLAEGKNVDKFNYFDTPKITKENINQFEKPSW